MDTLVARLRSAGCVFAEEEAGLLREAATSEGDLEQMAARRVAGEPLEQVLGWAAFAGMRIRLLPGVFVPRRRSELMVRLATDRLGAEQPHKSGPIGSREPRATRAPGDGGRDRSVLRLLDLGCGSGAIAAAVAARVPGLDLWAVDVDPDAVACARLNLPPERVLLGDLYEPLPAGLRSHVTCANAPYVPTDAIALMPPEARDHEHRVALDGGPDGLEVQRRVIGAARDHLVDGGVLLIETGRRQAEATIQLAHAAGMTAALHTDDEIEGTVVEARA